MVHPQALWFGPVVVFPHYVVNISVMTVQVLCSVYAHLNKSIPLVQSVPIKQQCRVVLRVEEYIPNTKPLLEALIPNFVFTLYFSLAMCYPNPPTPPKGPPTTTPR